METNQVEELLQQGIEFHRNNQFIEAEACYKQVLGIDPNNADAIHLLGLLADAIGDKDLAVDLIKNAIAIAPTSPIFHNNLANILKLKGETDLAIACYLEAIRLNPAYVEACFNFANLYRNLGRLDDAVPLYRQATAINPDLAIAWINLAETLHKSEQLEEAISCYKRFLELKPVDTYCKTQLANACFERGRELEEQGLNDKAKTYFEDALSALPTHSASQTKLDYLRDGLTRSLQQETKEPLNLDRKLVAIDIGCRFGFAEKFLKNIGLFQLYGFDPDDEECRRLKDLYLDLDISLVPVGLAGTSGKRTLYITVNPGCSSLLEPDPELTSHYPYLCGAKLIDQKTVETTTLDTWAKENEIKHIDYMKIDTQGTELEILQGGIGMLNQVRYLEIEVEFNPIYLNQPLFSDIDIFLRSHGFVLWKLANLTHYGRGDVSRSMLGEGIMQYDINPVSHATYPGQLYWAEAHFIKKDVLQNRPINDPQRIRDEVLFGTLGMTDIVDHISILNPQSAGLSALKGTCVTNNDKWHNGPFKRDDPQLHDKLQSIIRRYYENDGTDDASVIRDFSHLNLDGTPDFIPDMISKTTPHDEDYVIFRCFESQDTLILDIGANWGYSVGSFWSVGATSKIVSFEAIPLYQGCLQRIADLRPDGYSYLMKALSSRPGKLKFVVPVINGVAITALTSASNKTSSSCGTLASNILHHIVHWMPSIDDIVFNLFEFEVEVNTLDHAIKEHPEIFLGYEISAIKMDVEGHEFEVLKGSKETLIKFKPLIMAEGGNRIDGIQDFMSSLGFLYAERLANKLTLVEGMGMSVNGFFIHQDKLEQYRAAGIL